MLMAKIQKWSLYLLVILVLLSGGVWRSGSGWVELPADVGRVGRFLPLRKAAPVFSCAVKTRAVNPFR